MSFDALLWDWRFQASEEAKSQSHAAPGKTIATRGSAYLIYEFDISQGCRSATAIKKNSAYSPQQDRAGIDFNW
jgi:hypothetical protein